MTTYWGLTWWNWALFAVIAVLVILPPRYDPAIRLKEWIMRRKK